jgi:hypothetical protein
VDTVTLRVASSIRVTLCKDAVGNGPAAKGKFEMKHLVLALSALALLGTVIPASAACPPGTAYNCYSTGNGKQSCGCR